MTDKEILERIGLKIRRTREDKKLGTQKELAEKCKMCHIKLNRMENGKDNVGITYLIKVARGLGVRVGSLIDN